MRKKILSGFDTPGLLSLGFGAGFCPSADSRRQGRDDAPTSPSGISLPFQLETGSERIFQDQTTPPVL